MRLLVVRHYKTEGNVCREIIGWDESPPADGWQADLEHVEKLLQKSDIHFHRIYTSDLRRARNTGLFYAQGLKIDDIRHHSALNEINYGTLNKKKKHWVEKHLPGHKTDPDLVYPKGESFSQMQQRSTDFIEALARAHSGRTFLIVVHAGIIRGLISYFLGLNYARNLKRRITHRYVGDFNFSGNACVGYDELGTRSGFVSAREVTLPWRPRRKGGH